MSLENVLMNDDDTIKVCDFGVAGKFSKHSKIRDKVFVGKAAYASPQLHYLQEYCPFKNDIWSMGIMLVRLAFGRDLWREPKSGLAALQASNNMTIRRLVERAAGEECEPLLIDLIVSMLRWDEEERPCISDILNHPWICS